MKTNSLPRIRPTSPSRTETLHPADFLAESILPALGMSISQAARQLGLSRQSLHRVLKREAPIGPELALRLEEVTGCVAEVWLLLQMSVDLSKARLARPSQRSAA